MREPYYADDRVSVYEGDCCSREPSGGKGEVVRCFVMAE